jgi:hypothetical protein
MALNTNGSQVETGVMDLVAEEETQAKTEVAMSAQDKTEVAMSAQATVKPGDPTAFLKELGINDVQIDWTSFPMITLNNEIFSTAANKGFGDKFKMVYLSHYSQWLFKGDLGRDKEPELVYSRDALHDEEGKLISEYIEDWKARDIPWDRSEYYIVVAEVLDGPHKGDVCQIQVSPSSRGAFSGYLIKLAMKRIDPRTVVTDVSVGAERGAGRKAFCPFEFALDMASVK